MAGGDFIGNQALGRIRTYAELGAANDALLLILLKSAGLEADDVLRDYDTLAALLAGTNDEADFTSYVRKTLAGVVVTVDDVNNRLDIDANDVNYAAYVPGVNNTIHKALVCYDPDTTVGTDADLIVVAGFNVTISTDGNAFDIVVAATGLLRSAG